MNFENNLLISFSGGKTSAFMTKLILESPKYKNWPKLIVFANTGKENEQTLEFVNRCDEEWGLGLFWVEAKVNPDKGKGTTFRNVDFETASRNGEPFEAVIQKYGLPSRLYRHCTRELKQAPIHKLAKWVFQGEDYLTAIGIRADEKRRIGKNKSFIYPLVEFGITKDFVNTWWSKQNFNLKLEEHEGNCDLCFLKSLKKKQKIVTQNPQKANWWAKMEELYSKQNQPIFDVYRETSVRDLLRKRPQTDKPELACVCEA